MKKWFAWLCLISLASVGFLGCGGNKPIIDLNEPQYAKIAIAPFAVDKGAEDMARLVQDLGTSLSLAVEDKEWIYDQSEQLAPIGNALKNDKLTAEEIFIDPALATKVGSNVGADLILVGKIGKPRIQTKVDPNIYYDKSTAFVTGTAQRFVLIIQSGIEEVDLKLVDVKTGEVSWEGSIKGYIKYFREFMQQDPAKDYARIPEGQLKADLRTHMLKQIQATLFPAQFSKISLPEILAKPKRPLIRSGGKPLLF